ncbi:MAG: hypothetical protein ACXABU_10430 [Candidatus Hodarchaeales archaeon]|jgi:hypothetical protein
MLKISFISAGTTSSQTPVMSTLGYELVKRWMKDQPEKIPNFPLACIFDFSNMYTTIQFFATDKILMRMGELTSITEEMKESQTLDWSKCSFPSKFAHKDTNEPLFFMLPVFERGMTSFVSKSDTLELTRHICEIAESIEKAGTKYVFFDLPLIEARQQRFFEIAALLNSNLILGIVDLNKVSVDKVISEIQTLEEFLKNYSMFAEPGLSLNGLVFNKISEKTLSEKWVEQVMESFSYPVLGMIREDPEFTKIIPHYELPTVDSQFHKMKCAKDFQSATEMILQIISDSTSLRAVTGEQVQNLENKIFSN